MSTEEKRKRQTIQEFHALKVTNSDAATDIYDFVKSFYLNVRENINTRDENFIDKEFTRTQGLLEEGHKVQLSKDFMLKLFEAMPTLLEEEGILHPDRPTVSGTISKILNNRPRPA